jgi:phage-related protein
MKYFDTVFLKEAKDFLVKLERKSAKKVLYNVELAEKTKDPRLLKKLEKDIWEFRTRYKGVQIRFLAFWYKHDDEQTLVIATHGFIKKTNKVPSKEIKRATVLREKFLNRNKK